MSYPHEDVGYPSPRFFEAHGAALPVDAAKRAEEFLRDTKLTFSNSHVRAYTFMEVLEVMVKFAEAERARLARE